MTDVHDASPLTALVVDDDAMLRMDVVAMLEDAGFLTLDAEDVDSALSVLGRHHATIALLFSDVDMPGTRDGFGLAREVAARWPGITVVIASGRRRPGPGDLPDGVCFIAKPFSAELVHGHLREIMPEHRRPAKLKD
ncbi:response regulator [Lichenibacterium ramalinae]|uniref:Response regulator n=1 Tax=Lichenibacterium ramalinae TaxID=2316527 RepID=A0A4Q2RGY4_9HYPH|nr:response regulator [Lichenibacterium ramalinae]RYB06964.1 response regulator [Lichenibacterium ramalinae]